MKVSRLAIAAMLLAASATAVADGGGSLVVKGKTYTLKSAYAYSRPDTFEPQKQETVIGFSERVLDARKIDEAADRRAMLQDLMYSYVPQNEERPVGVELKLPRARPDNPITAIKFTVRNESGQASARADRYEFVITRNDDTRIEGTLRSKVESEKTADFGAWVDLHFALDVKPAKP